MSRDYKFKVEIDETFNVLCDWNSREVAPNVALSRIWKVWEKKGLLEKWRKYNNKKKREKKN